VTALQGTRGVVLLGAGLGLALLGAEIGEARFGLGEATALVSLVPIALGLVLGGPLAAGVAVATTLAGVAVWLGTSAAVVVGLRVIVPGLVLGTVLLRRLHLATCLVLVGAGSLLGLLALVWAYVPAPTGLLALLRRQLEVHTADVDRLSSLLGLNRDPAWVAESARMLAATMRIAGPAIFAVGLLVVALTNYIGARLCLRGRGFRGFAEEAVPDHLVWGVIAAGAMLISQQEMIGVLGLNFLIVLAFLYAIQGLAVLRHFFQKARVPRPLQGISFGLFAVQPLLLIAAACLGLSDLWADFRKIRRAATPA
jgi:uncharacterized protein YybS (DUF2232 family)